jgi:WD40 repeat protein
MQQLLIASVGQDGMLCLWQYDSGVRPRSIAAHRGSVNAVAFSSSGDAIVTGGGIERGDFSLQVWDLRSDRAIQTLTGHSDWPLWVGFSHRGDLLASGSYGEICVWDARSWRLLKVLRRPDSLRLSTIAFSFTSDPRTFVSGGWAHEEEQVEVRDTSGSLVGWNSKSKGLVQLWDLETGQLRDSFTAHDDALTCLAASPTEGILVTAGKDGATKAWSLWDD